MALTTNQHNEFVRLGTEEDAVGSDGFSEVFVDVVICAAVEKENRAQESQSGSSFGSTAHRDTL